MKNIIKHIIAVCLFCVSFSAFGQSSHSLKLAHSLKDKTTAMSIDVKESGMYDVLILSPSGEIQSQPIRKKTVKDASSIDFKINSKYWKSGEYQVLVQNEFGGIVTSRTIRIDLSEREKARLRGPE